ncbi:glycosyltransferase family 9 protein [Terrabacter sp. NPDC080008]|uniref:glycosyltransferase family 9 protein n=1 Tax=Terrabacter sp. NPDC080008 TaxID=3155176 RepID=UPI00344E86B5
MSHVLVVRLDNAGDVLVAGPAVRAVAAGADRVTLVCGPHGAAAGELLPGVDEVVTWGCPWIDPSPAPVEPAHMDALVELVRMLAPDRALVLTSFHQSPLPTALLLRLAGVPWVGAASTDYPGSLLDLRHQPPDDLHEVERALSLVRAAGYELPDGDDGRLAVRPPQAPWLPWVASAPWSDGFVVLHPGASVPARAWPEHRWQELARLLSDRGRQVVVTGGPGERALTARVAAAYGSGDVLDLGGQTTLGELAGVLGAASVVVAANTGPAHLAAAVRTPVVSLFAPTVPFERWRPWGVPVVALGRGDAPCRGTRVTTCPFPGHPCLTSVAASEACQAVEALAPQRRPSLASPEPLEDRAVRQTVPGGTS